MTNKTPTNYRCPVCLANPGEPCESGWRSRAWNRAKVPAGGYYHVLRKRAARVANERRTNRLMRLGWLLYHTDGRGGPNPWAYASRGRLGFLSHADLDVAMIGWRAADEAEWASTHVESGAARAGGFGEFSVLRGQPLDQWGQ